MNILLCESFDSILINKQGKNDARKPSSVASLERVQAGTSGKNPFTIRNVHFPTPLWIPNRPITNDQTQSLKEEREKKEEDSRATKP